MGCQKTQCMECREPYKACQLVNGVCSSCRAKQTTPQQVEAPKVLKTRSPKNNWLYNSNPIAK